MSKRARVWNIGKFNRYVREGRGQGEGINYSPWIHIQDFPSLGIVSRVLGSKTGRVHHFMSSNERNYFYLLEWSADVFDIREQYPLIDFKLAINLAEKAGIRYPRDLVSGFPYILTSDFMITTNSGLKARTIKLSSELQNPRVLEKLEIERRYWNSLGIDWHIVTEHEIPMSKVKNIEWLHTAGVCSDEIKSFIVNENILTWVRNLYCQSYYSLYDLATLIDSTYGFLDGTGMKVMRHLLWTKQLPCMLNLRLQGYPMRHSELAGV